VSTNFNNRQLPGNSPLANVLVVVLGAIAIAVSFVIGFVAFVALAAAVLVFGAVVWIRIAWLGLRVRKQGGKQTHAGDSQTTGHSVIEGEYHVIPAKKGDDNSSQT
jgi:uncharacterized membrane protein